MEKMRVSYNYLNQQFDVDSALVRQILADIKELVRTSEFTLGPQVEEFEKKFASLCGTKHAIGINSGTDALILILKALGIGPGDEVITAPNSFIATANVIRFVGAKPVFVDVGDDYLINHLLIEKAITPRTKAILSVHLTGNPASVLCISEIAQRFKLYLIEDAAQAVDASVNGRKTGSWGIAGAFSLHPLKNLNVWGDGGMVTTNNNELAEKVRLMRNHGLVSRDVCTIIAGNCRLHTIQAVVGLRLMPEVRKVSEKRIENAILYRRLLTGIDSVKLPLGFSNVRQVYHTYIIQAERREELQRFLEKNGVETKVHYPVPIHLQKPYIELGYKKGDFPVCEAQAERILSLPIHQYLTKEQIRYTAGLIRKFYGYSSIS